TEQAALAALDEKALVSPSKIYDPAEKGIISGKFHFDRVKPEVKKAMLALLLEAKKDLLAKLEVDATQAGLKPAFAELEKLMARYLLLLEGADSATARLTLDPQTADAVVDVTLTPKPNTALAKEIAARKPATNRFAGLVTPDTVAGGHL